MTDLKDQLESLFADEPPSPRDLERVVALGRRARRRRNAGVAAAGTLGAAGLTVAVVVPIVTAGGNGTQISVGVQPSPTPTVAAGHCEFVVGARQQQRTLDALTKKAKAAGARALATRKLSTQGGKNVLEVCPKGVPLPDAPPPDSEPAAGTPYHYTEQPKVIASRLGAHLHDRVSGFGLSITYARAFAQESTSLDKGTPSYFDGNVDVRESQGYGDIGVQVTHAVTEQVPFTGACEDTAPSYCQQTTLADGSVLRTQVVHAGPGAVLHTAEIHRTDGVVVAAQESNYPFGPGAPSEQSGTQPLTDNQLVALADDPMFTF